MVKARFSPQVFFVFCLFWVESVQWYVNDRNNVQKVGKLRSNEFLFSYRVPQKKLYTV